MHAGSLVAALASWLDARAHGGQWLVRIEDVDTPRCIDGMAQHIMQQLAALGLLPDEPPLYQSQRGEVYQAALDGLITRRLAYPCRCSRKDIEAALQAQGHARQRGGELVYPGTCRPRLRPEGHEAWRLRTDVDADSHLGIHWQDRRLGPQHQHVAALVGDFPLKRADGCFTYQLAVVVDDAVQGITDVVRGEDLADNTARQILLQRALGLTAPRTLHTPLVRGANGEKLSKQNGAIALDTANPLAAIAGAASALGLKTAAVQVTAAGVTEALQRWVAEWRELYNLARD